MNDEERRKAHRVYISIRAPHKGVPDGRETGGSTHLFKTAQEAQNFAKWISANAEQIRRDSQGGIR